MPIVYVVHYYSPIWGVLNMLQSEIEDRIVSDLLLMGEAKYPSEK